MASKKRNKPRPAPAFTIKPLPPIAPARRKEILAERDTWLRKIDPAFSFHRLFDVIPGVQFFAKDRQGRTMLLNRGSCNKFHVDDETTLVGLTDFDLSPPSLAQSYVDDDARIYLTGKPLLNHVELGFDEQAMPGWFVVNKMPIRSRTGEIIGIMGFSQAYEERAKLLPPFQSIAKAVSYLRRDFQQDISIRDLVRLVGLSARQLERKFKSYFGIGPQQFLIKTRLLAAARRLCETDEGLAEIAADCGFNEPSAFARQFRRHLGMTPHDFRHSRIFGRRTRLAGASGLPESGSTNFLEAPPIAPGRRSQLLLERNAWLGRIDPTCSFHRMFDAISELQFFAKNQHGRMMLVNRGNCDKFHVTDETAMVGLTDFDLSPPHLAQSYVNDDARIYATGKALLNQVELGFDEQGAPDWFIVNKMPIRSRSGEIIGIMGLSQTHEERAKLLLPFQSISKAVSHVRQSFRQDISVCGLARLVGLSTRHLQRKFKGCFGIGPQQFLIKTRLLAACRRLTTTDDSLVQIAADCAFTHPSAFAHQFRLHLGMTPSEFRRQRLTR